METTQPHIETFTKPEVVDFEPQPYWPEPPTKQAEPNKVVWTTKEIIWSSIVGVAMLGGLSWFVWSKYKKTVRDKETKKSFEDGSSQSIARLIKMAVVNDGSFGIDEEALRVAISQVKTQEQWLEVSNSYEKQFSKSLMTELSDALQTSELNEMMAIINAKPSKTGKIKTISKYLGWARRIKAAFGVTYMGISGTDEPALLAVLNEVPTQIAFALVGVSYKKEFARDILQDMKSESEFGQFNKWIMIINKKPK